MQSVDHVDKMLINNFEKKVACQWSNYQQFRKIQNISENKHCLEALDMLVKNVKL